MYCKSSKVAGVLWAVTAADREFVIETLEPEVDFDDKSDLLIII